MSNNPEDFNDITEEEEHIIEEEEKELAKREGSDSAYAFVNASEGEFIDDDDMGKFEDEGNDDDDDDDNCDECEDDDESMEPKEPVEDMATMTFKGHTDSVLCVALCPLDNDTVATGGCDDTAYLWSASTGEIKHTLKGHTDSVSVLKFSVHDNGKYIATGCMDGSVIIWLVETGKMVQTLDGPSDEIEWIEWHPKGPVIVAGSADCSIWLWNAITGACLTVFSGHSDAVSCGAIVNDGRAVVTGSFDGSVRVWDPKHSSPLTFIKFDSSVISLASTNGTDNTIIVGCDDGSAYICNTLTGKTVQKLNLHTASVEALGFVNIAGNAMPVTASSDGTIGIWEGKSGDLRLKLDNVNGVVRMVCHPTQPVIYTCSMDGAVRVFDARNGSCVRTLTGHTDIALDVAISKVGDIVLTASDDKTSKVFRI